jgi:hypothetical protein
MRTLLDAEFDEFGGHVGSADCQMPFKKPWKSSETAYPELLNAPQTVRFKIFLQTTQQNG